MNVQVILIACSGLEDVDEMVLAKEFPNTEHADKVQIASTSTFAVTDAVFPFLHKALHVLQVKIVEERVFVYLLILQAYLGYVQTY